MSQIKLIHDFNNARVVLEDDTLNAFYTDELGCPNEVIDRVVELYNTGLDLLDIDKYLLDEEKCSSEDREIMIEGLYYIYKKLIWKRGH